MEKFGCRDGRVDAGRYVTAAFTLQDVDAIARPIILTVTDMKYDQTNATAGLQYWFSRNAGFNCHTALLEAV